MKGVWKALRLSNTTLLQFGVMLRYETASFVKTAIKCPSFEGNIEINYCPWECMCSCI